MKKIISSCLIIFFIGATGFSQSDSVKSNPSLYSKRGTYVLPVKGELSIGIDAYPLFNYIGNMFSNDGASSPYINYGNTIMGSNGIYAKYMISSKTALRVAFRADNYIEEQIYVVDKSTLTFDPEHPEYVDDLVKYIGMDQSISVGIEKRRGKTKVQGIFGAEVLMGSSSYTNKYTYGNAITSEFPTPETFNNDYINGHRLIEDHYYSSFYSGARAFLGAEIFVAPKISLGCEFGYSILYRWGGNREQIYEYWDGVNLQVSQVVTKSTWNGENSFFSGIDQLDGSINLFFYF